MPRKTMTCSSMVALIALGLATAAAMAGGGPKMKHGNYSYGIGQVALCPPGLAKKNPPCVPPGLAKSFVPRAYEQDDDYLRRYYDGQDRLGDGDQYGWTRPDGTVIRIGDPLTGLPYHLIVDPELYGLPQVGDARRYAIADNRIVRIDPDTLQIMSLIRLVDGILD